MCLPTNDNRSQTILGEARDKIGKFCLRQMIDQTRFENLDQKRFENLGCKFVSPKNNGFENLGGQLLTRGRSLSNQWVSGNSNSDQCLSATSDICLINVCLAGTSL